MIKYILILFIFTSCINPQSGKNLDQVVETMASQVAKKNSDIETITAKDLMIKAEQKSFDSIIVDVRTQLETQTSMIPGSVSKETFTKHKQHMKDKTIFAYCTIGARSSAFARELKKEGFNVISLKGGVLSWAHAGGRFLKEDKPTKEVYFLNKAWNLLPKEYKGKTP